MRRLHRQLAGLADGTRDSATLRERVDRDPELAGLLAEQERAVAIVRAAQPVPSADLRSRLAHAEPVVRRPRPNRGLLAAAAGVIALAIVALLPGASRPTVARAAQLASLGPTGGAPTPDAAHPGSLSDAVGGIRYPYWQDAFGFTASGTRTDRLDGRTVMTVYYTSAANQRTGYTIVSGAALPQPAGATVLRRDGTDFLSQRDGSRTVLTWRRDGHTCILSTTSGVSVGRLLALASWRPADA
ncbi:MAG TPA: hypothetical protein VHW26_09755 [Solirubrobacteraceae bacterium]|jgi:hypothetical protein|nr:hypothetical protein [Solirubrobacteraceae bacterium]